MSRQTFKCTLFLTGMLIASTAFADPELVRCVNSDGHVTLTDAACLERDEAVSEVAPEAAPVSAPESTASLVSARSAVAPSAAAGKTLVRQRPAAALPRNAWATKVGAGRSVSPDVETLKAARLNMQTQDSASLALRQQRLAALN